jgi:hypothetical protein
LRGAVDWRTTISGTNDTGFGGAARGPIKSAAAALPISRIGSRTVVNGGQMRDAIGVSSKPTIERSPGTSNPARLAAW